VLFLVSMCVAAVVLDHHWIVDVLLGLAYTLAVFAATMLVARSRTLAPRRDVPVRP
jgi:membrane-associated phospholipid phosphatase